MEDLFSEYKKTSFDKKDNKHNSIEEGIFISPEMFIGAVIIFIICIVLSFSIGVEQGKHLKSPNIKALKTAKINSNKIKRKIRDKRSKKEKLNAKQLIKSISTPNNKTIKKLKETKTIHRYVQNKISSYDRYAVQLIVYKDAKYVKSELNYLSKQKYPFFQKKKNGKIIIYAGPFASREQAETAMQVLRKRYKDCFVKIIKK